MGVTVDIRRTDSSHPDFLALVRSLDEEIAERDGDEHEFYAKYNSADDLKNVVLVYRDGRVCGCGAMKPFSPDTMEIKRMYVPPPDRRTGIASRVLAELERWAQELSMSAVVLETGKRQPEALALYTARGYTPIPNYGQYAGIANSVCFTKTLI